MSSSKPPILSTCAECGKTFRVFRKQTTAGKGKYCSVSCARKGWSPITDNGIPKWIGGSQSGSRQRSPSIPGVDPKHYGALAEIMACEWLVRQGYELFRNMSSHGVADLIAWRLGETPILIDVKTTTKEGRTQRHFARLTGAQVTAGVQLLHVDRTSRTISFNRQDFGPRQPARDYKERYLLGVERQASLAQPLLGPSPPAPASP